MKENGQVFKKIDAFLKSVVLAFFGACLVFAGIMVFLPRNAWTGLFTVFLGLILMLFGFLGYSRLNKIYRRDNE
jgi:hypothetical protein